MHDKKVVLLTNTGTRCELGGYPTLAGVKNGAELPLGAGHGTWFGDLSKSAIATGEQGQLWLQTNAICTALPTPSDPAGTATRAANTYSALIVILPGKHGSLTLSGATLDVACGLDETQLGLPPSGSGDPQTVENLTVALSLPRGVSEKTSNGVLHYNIELFNGMTSTIPCDPPQLSSCPGLCPDYRVTLTALEGSARRQAKVLTRETTPLECAQVLPIAPGATKRLSLALRLPEVSSQTTVLIKWLIVVPTRLITSLVGGIGTFGGTKEALHITPS